MLFGLAEQREHQRVRVDDARRRGEESGDALQFRLEGARICAIEPLEVRDPVLCSDCSNALEIGELILTRSDDQLAAAPVGHAVLLAVLVEQVTSAHAAARLQRSLGVVKARVHHFAVARARFRADRRVPLQHQHLAARERKFAGDGEADHAGADHDALDIIRARQKRVGLCRKCRFDHRKSLFFR